MEPTTPGTTETILVVDDEPCVLDLVSDALRRQGYVTLLARNPQAALRICEQHPGTIHILLTDLLMPGMNGLELVTRVFALRPQIRVLYMSDSSVVANAFAAEHEVAFLEKPFGIGALINTVGELLSPHAKKGISDIRK